MLRVLLIGTVAVLAARGETVIETSPGRGNVQRAVDSVRGHGESARIVLAEGRYELDGPLILTAQDANLTIEAADGAKPVISAGRRIVDWRLDGKGWWRACVPASFRVSQFYVNGERRFRPRMPRKGYFHIARQCAAEPGTGRERFVCGEGEFPSGDNPDLEICIFHVWTMSRTPVLDFNPRTRSVTLARPRFRQDYELLTPDRWYLYDNVRSTLGEPGDWYHDRQANELIYVPRPGETPTSCEAVASAFPHAVRVVGATNIVFRGIEFAHADYGVGPEGNHYPQAAANQPGAVQVEGGRDIRFVDCAVRHTGAYGVAFLCGAEHCGVESCELTDLGAGGVRIGDETFDAKVAVLSRDCVVRDCLISGGGRVDPAGVGVWIGHASGNLVSHNTICDLYYSGVSVGWNWRPHTTARDNVIEWNHIHGLGQGVLSDMGGIYTLGCQPGTVERFNFIHDVRRARNCGFGIYFDSGSSLISVSNNVVYDCEDAGWFLASISASNRVEKNVFGAGRSRFQVRCQPRASVARPSRFAFNHVELSGEMRYLQHPVGPETVDFEGNDVCTVTDVVHPSLPGAGRLTSSPSVAVPAGFDPAPPERTYTAGDTRPYEFRVCDRTDDLKPALQGFEPGEKWRIESVDADVSFAIDDGQRLFGKTTGSLKFRPKRDGAWATLSCLDFPGFLTPEFDFMSVWVCGDRFEFGANSQSADPTPILYADFRLKDGSDRRLFVGDIWSKGWYFMTRKLTADERKDIVAFSGFCVSNLVVTSPGELRLDNIAFWKDEMKPLDIEPRAKRPLKPLPGADQGLNTGVGILPFPVREETILQPTDEPQPGDLLADFNGGAADPKDAGALRMTRRRVGKSLIVDFYAEAGAVKEISAGCACEAKVLKRINVPHLSYGEDEARLKIDLLEGGWYRSAVFDWYRSNASTVSARDGMQTMLYKPKTDGAYCPVSERLVITLSRNFDEVLPVIPNPPSPWKHVTGKRLWRPHGASDRARDAQFWRTMHRYGMTEVVVNDHETMWRDEGESYTYRTTFAEGKGGDRGQYDYTRLMRDELGYVYGPYNNFWDHAPVNRNFTLDDVTRLPDGSYMTSWMRTYAPKIATAPAWTERLVPEVQRKMDFNSAYCDCHTAGSPWDRTDYDARLPGAATLSGAFYTTGEMLLLQKKLWNGPIYSEGAARMFCAGLIDGNYADDRGFKFQTEPWIVDFDLLRIHPLECDFAVGTLSMFRRSPETMEQRYYRPHITSERDRTDLIDRYLALTVAFGHAGFLIADWCFRPDRTFGEAYGPLSPREFDFAGGLPIAWRSYYMIQAAAARYTQAEADSIRYADAEGRMKPVSSAIADGTVCRNQIAVRYSDRTYVFANGNETERMRISFGGTKVDLPPRGYRVWTADGKLLVDSSEAYGARADYCESPDYIYFDARGHWANAPKARGTGPSVCRTLADGWEIIHLGADDCAFAIPGTRAVALDFDGREIGAAEVETRDGWLSVRPLPGAVSYKVYR